MKRDGFKGGVHPWDGKSLSKDKKIEIVAATKEMVYPLSQHIGAPAKAVVKVGDEVLVGQTIAVGESFVSADVIASVSGKVKAIEPRTIAQGIKVDSIIIENDEEDRAVEGLGNDRDYEKLSKEEIREIVKKAGVVGMGGAAFPTHVKLTPKNDEDIDYVIVNGAECEPYLTSDYRVMLENGEELVKGLKVILKLFDNAKGIIAMEDNKPECAKYLKELVKDEENIKVKVLKTKYPQGAERQLIYATTKRKVDSTKLPVDVGCIVNNVDSIVAIYNAVIKRKPLMERIVTITGEAIRNPQNMRVHIGTNYKELIDEAGGFIEEPVKIVSGGPMMGFGIFELDLPTTKTASALLCLTRDEVSEMEPSACINCGRCLEVCPGRVMPSKLATLAEKHKEEEFIAYDGMECCECGCCSYVCPAKRHLTQSIKSMRKIVLSKRKK